MGTLFYTVLRLKKCYRIGPRYSLQFSDGVVLLARRETYESENDLENGHNYNFWEETGEMQDPNSTENGEWMVDNQGVY